MDACYTAWMGRRGEEGGTEKAMAKMACQRPRGEGNGREEERQDGGGKFWGRLLLNEISVPCLPSEKSVAMREGESSI